MQGEARQAREFGYAVSSGPAREIAGGADYADVLSREVAQVEAKAEKDADSWTGCAAVFLIGVGVILFFALPEFPPVVPLFLVVCLMLAGAFFRWGIRREAVKDKERYAAQIEALGKPWQVWPCRIEEAPDIVPHLNSEVLGTLAARAQAGRATTAASGRGDAVDVWKVHRVFLLAPGGAPARTFAAFLPDTVWRGMVDGLGPLWVCGDLRHRVVMATPGAGQAWIALPNTPPPAVDSPRSSGGLIEDIARDAGREALLNWFT